VTHKHRLFCQAVFTPFEASCINYTRLLCVPKKAMQMDSLPTQIDKKEHFFANKRKSILLLLLLVVVVVVVVVVVFFL
jgi:hypothetical protein